MRVRLPDALDHALDEFGVMKGLRGQVDGDLQVNSHPVPIDRLGRGGREHPVRQGFHQAPNLGQRDDPVCRERSLARMVPANQSLDPADFPGLEIELGLIMELQLIPLDGQSQFTGEL